MNDPHIFIAGRRISVSEPPYIVAELSANHNGRIENAFHLIEAAKEAGADAIKIQTYKPETITLDCNTEDFMIRGGLWDGQTLYQLYEIAHTPWEWHKALFDYARKLGITMFSSPFDTTAVDLLEDLNVPAYKIASLEIVDLSLIKYAASTGKPLIISTGIADAEEIEGAIDAAYQGGCQDLAVLHCVSGYPAPADDYNLRTLADMIHRFGRVTGLSDHTLENTTALVSVAMGASIIEKHVTLNRNGGGPDDSFSIEPTELAALCRGTRVAWSALGKVDYGCKSSELANVKFRRSLYFTRNLNAGDVITEGCVRSVRPGLGLPPSQLCSVLGRRLTRDVSFGTPVSWSVLSPVTEGLVS